MKWLCVWFDLHKWEWYLPNDKGTIIGTQICRRCNKLRGVRVDRKR